MQEKNDKSIKDIRTLVICKVNPNWSTKDAKTNYIEIYKKLILGEFGTTHRYISLGGPDAICIYKTSIRDGNKQWLSDVLADKHYIISESTPDISYHPVHVVSDEVQDSFWNNVSSYPFLFVSFLYGVESPLTAESAIISQLQNAGLSEENSITAIYRSINISDFVVFTAAKELICPVRALSTIDKNGIARRTYTTVNLPLEEGTIPETVLDSVSHVSDTVGVSIQGTIRAIRNWKNTIKKTAEALGLVVRLNYGAEDFNIRGDLSGPELKKMLSYFMDHSEELSIACWDIHTEIQSIPGDDENGSGPTDIPSLIEEEFTSLTKNASSLDTQPWYYHYREMMFTQMNIDKHPLLTGPAHMFFDSIHVANRILTDSFQPSSLSDISDPIARIAKSQLGIERYIRCANQLSDQLTRNDDVLFHGLGRTPSIVTTLPEMMLEFYHAFFRDLSDFLTSIEPNSEAGNSFEYGFILAPKISERMNISPMFENSVHFKKLSPENRFQHWPDKQVFIIQFPADDIYRPMDCFIPLAHECFHFFGDGARCRSARFYNMVSFISVTFLASLGLDRYYYRELYYSVANILIQTEEKYDRKNIYSAEAGDIFLDKLHYLFTDDGLKELYENSGHPYYLYSKSFLDRWLDIKYHGETASNPVTYVRLCLYLFRECHADIMAMEIFGIKPIEYLEQISHEIHAIDNVKTIQSEQETKGQQVMLSQRMAIVLAAYCSKGGDAKRRKDSFESIMNCQNGLGPDVSLLVSEFFRSIIEEKAKPVNDDSAVPAAALCSVVDYLVNVRKYLENNTSKEKREKLNDAFDKIIRECDMFGEEFYNIIEAQRTEVKNRAKTNSSLSNP